MQMTGFATLVNTGENYKQQNRMLCRIACC